MAKIILDGFEARVARDLARVLSGQGHQVAVGWQGGSDSADALFCSADAADYPAVVREVRLLQPEMPVIVVSSQPDQDKWLDALDAGAADYCCAPFETAQLTHLLAGVLGHAPELPAKRSAARHV